VKPKLLTTISDYSWRAFLADTIAGTTVALVALPLSIAIAIASGAQPIAGLITAIIGGFLISLLGGSRVQIGGPTGAFIVVVHGVIQSHGFDGLLIATFMAGIILVIGGLLRAGRLIALVPEAVIEGFTVGIALVIAAGQLNNFFGLPPGTFSGGMASAFSKLWNSAPTMNHAAVTTGIATVAGITLLRRFLPWFPSSILVIGAASAVTYWLALPVETIQSRFGQLPGAIPVPSLPVADVRQIVALLPSAAVIAFLAAVESLLSAIVADRMIKSSHRSNAELLAQGAANIFSPLFGGLPATGAIARTATNVRAGGRTPVAGLVHALVILAITLFASQVVGLMAMPALAGLLILTAWLMSEPHRWGERWRLRRSERALFILTLILTVAVGLTAAIASGTLIGLALRMLPRDESDPEWTPSDRLRP